MVWVPFIGGPAMSITIRPLEEGIFGGVGAAAPTPPAITTAAAAALLAAALMLCDPLLRILASCAAAGAVPVERLQCLSPDPPRLLYDNAPNVATRFQHPQRRRGLDLRPIREQSA